MTQQHYESWRISYQSSESAARAAWKEMIRVHHRANELEAQLSAIGAGGVEPLRKPASQQAVQAAVPVGTKFFSFDPCDDLVLHDTAEAACAAAQQSIDLYREYAAEGWAEEVERVCWGMILGQALETKLSEDLPPDAFSAGVAGSLPPVDYVLHAPAHPAEGAPAQVVELEVDDLIDRLLDAQQDLNLAANVHMDQSIASASTLLDKVEIALRTLSATHATQQGMEQPIKWPKARDVGRFGDMSPDGSIRVGLDADNDVYVSICDGTSVADIEFCTPGGGGGRSSRTRMALIALMCAIEADNASHPAFDFWQRNLAAQAKQGEQANG